MILINKKTARFTLSIFMALVPMMSLGQAIAAAGSMSLSPASTSASIGSTFTISVYENSGSNPVDTAQANLSYSSNLIDFVSISSSSAFPIVAQSSGGNGSVVIARGATPGASLTGSQLIATVRFKAKASSGNASVSFASGSTIVSGGSDVSVSTSGATIALKAAPAPKPAAPKDTTPPQITGISVTDITNNSATVNWTTSEPSNSGVDYGPTTTYGLAAADSAMVTTHKVVLNSALLTPGQLYHFVIKSIDAAGNTAAGTDRTFSTAGLDMVITVIDQNKKPVAKANVNFQGKSAKTDKNGRATLKDLKLQDGNLVVTYSDKQTSQFVKVDQTAP
ncbi:MAG: cohesin domain-containing protein, partial [Candidatus Saccharimonadales bacterium]